VARRKITVELAPMMGAFNAVASADSSVEHILDAGADLMLRYGLTRWSMEDVAERAAIGRTTVYRSFASRDELVHAVLARELRATIGRITAAAAAADSPEDGIVEGALTGLAALRSSLVEKLLVSDPGTILPFLTTSAGAGARRDRGASGAVVHPHPRHRVPRARRGGAAPGAPAAAAAGPRPALRLRARRGLNPAPAPGAGLLHRADGRPSP
jgi:AcrR family transcriptional regulator